MAQASERTTLDQFQLSFPIRMLNRVGAGLESLHLRIARLEAEALIAQARHETGLTDWGDDLFLADIKVLIESFEHNSALHLLGRLGFRQEFRRMLVNRLRHVELIDQHPEILDVPIERPLFILGLPRTGTTLLHKLFAQAENMRVPPLWQLMSPFPLSEDGEETRRRIRQAETTAYLTYFVAPLFRVMHEMDAHQPEECVFLLPHHLVHHGRGDVPDYAAWYLEHDAIADYVYYKQQLQILQWQQPAQHWVMKTPFHLFKLDALLEVFPDACIIQTHRDPAKVIPSWCSFEAAIGLMHRSRVDRARIGREWSLLWKTAMDRSMVVRDSNHAGQFFDLQYADLIADPVGMIRQMCQHFDYSISESSADAMQRWLDGQSHEKHGVHRYSAAQFGLSETLIRDEFRRYVERFNVCLEA
jgi:hypothetical protein